MNNPLFALIHDYLTDVKRSVALLKQFFATDDVLRASRERKLKTGSYQNIDFQFHGMGCRITLDGKTVDFDFGPSDRCDGFDAFRLWNYATERSSTYPTLLELPTIEKEIQVALVKGMIVKSEDDSPTPHLYYLNKAEP